MEVVHFGADHSEVFAAEENGATPTEILMVALASCLSAGVAAIAQCRNIQLRRVVATVEGSIDLRGTLGIDRDARNGFSVLRVNFDIDADAAPDEISALVEQSRKRSAVLDALVNPARVRATVIQAALGLAGPQTDLRAFGP